MQLNKLYLKNFRNYREAEAEFNPGVNLIIGDNANGKTNLLEAITYISAGKSFRTRKEQEMILFGEEFAEIRANVFSQEREQEMKAFLFGGRKPRQLFLNGVKQKTAGTMQGILTNVLFCPEDLMVLKKGSAPRRKTIDNTISQIRPNYTAAITEYGKLLEQKSALLKEYRERPSLLEILPEYNMRMVQVGAIIISYRARYLKSLEEEARKFHRDFSGDKEELSILYKTVSTIDDPFAATETIRQKLNDHMESHYRAELESGQCLSGPHKDDFESRINGLPVEAFASQGQTRTATISLKLAEREIMKKDTGEEPVLLLDDVLSELDVGRQDFVLNQLKSGQVFITCCEEDRLTKIGKIMRIANGSVEER